MLLLEVYSFCSLLNKLSRACLVLWFEVYSFCNLLTKLSRACLVLKSVWFTLKCEEYGLKNNNVGSKEGWPPLRAVLRSGSTASNRKPWRQTILYRAHTQLCWLIERSVTDPFTVLLPLLLLQRLSYQRCINSGKQNEKCTHTRTHKVHMLFERQDKILFSGAFDDSGRMILLNGYLHDCIARVLHNKENIRPWEITNFGFYALLRKHDITGLDTSMWVNTLGYTRASLSVADQVRPACSSSTFCDFWGESFHLC